MAAPSGVYSEREKWRGLISSWFESALLEYWSNCISSPQATTPRKPKYASGKGVPGFSLPLDHAMMDNRGYLLPAMPWVERLKRAAATCSSEGGTQTPQHASRRRGQKQWVTRAFNSVLDVTWFLLELVRTELLNLTSITLGIAVLVYLR